MRSISEDTLSKLRMEHKRSMANGPYNYIRAYRPDEDKDMMRQRVYTDNVKMPSENVFVIMEAPKNAQGQRRSKREVPIKMLSDVHTLIEYANAYDKLHSVRRRSVQDAKEEDQVLEKMVQDLEVDRNSQGLTEDVLKHIHSTDWSNTPCAKKTFCEVMVAQPADELFHMEKKMDSFLKM